MAWKLLQSPRLTELTVAPGNPGIARVARCVEVDLASPVAVCQLAQLLRIELVVVGPEQPLVAGVADALHAVGIAVFGPVAAAARLEGSKAFAKEIMSAARVPTASSRTFTDAREAEAYARTLSSVVVKADGLAGGKGVVVAQSASEGVEAVRALSRTEAGARLVLEELLQGEEISVIALCDGDRYLLFPPAQDHKRVGDGDVGPNTGGMGAYAPVSRYLGSVLEEIGERAVAPVLQELKRRGAPFRGALFAGLMITAEGPKVLEYNCRLGDPETQVLLMQLDEDLLPLLWDCAQGELSPRPLKLHPGASVGVVLAAEGYPGPVVTGDVIAGLELPLGAGLQIFEAGTAQREAQRVTAGGRVLTLAARGTSLSDARARAYEASRHVTFRGCHFRRDIGTRGLLLSPP